MYKELEKHVPILELEFLVKRNGLPIKYSTKRELIEAIYSSSLPAETLEKEILELLNRYRFAGSKSICWSVVEQVKKISKEKFVHLIQGKFNRDPFVEQLRPEPTKVPVLNQAEWCTESLLRLEFAQVDKSHLVLQNYEWMEVPAMKLLDVFVRFLSKSIIVETRVGIADAIRLQRAVADLSGLGIEMMTFSNQEIELIKQKLGAKKKSAKHKKLGGDFDTVSVTASPLLDDLDDSEEYLKTLGKDDVNRARCQISYAGITGKPMEITLDITQRGSIWFLSEVPEEVIDYAFSIVKSIKRL
jgi:hypothetical protein